MLENGICYKVSREVFFLKVFTSVSLFINTDVFPLNDHFFLHDFSLLLIFGFPESSK